MSHLDSGFRRRDNEVSQAVYRISQLHTISPAEFVRETERDQELAYVRGSLLGNQMGQLPESYWSYRNALSIRYGLVLYDHKVIVPVGLQNTFVNLLHREHAGVDRMKEAAPYITWKTMDADLRRKVH